MNDVEFASNQHARRWCETLTRCVEVPVESLDSILGRFDPEMAVVEGETIWPKGGGSLPLNEETERVAIGVWVDDVEVSCAALAAQLSSFAVERDCEIIVLTEKHISGLERFGFRTERVKKDIASQSLFEVQRLWRIEVTL